MAARLIVDSDSDDEFLEQLLLRTRSERKIRVRPNHFDELNDDEFFMRFRLTKPTVLFLLDQIEHNLESRTDRNHSVSPINQLLLALRFYACGNMLISVGDFAGVHKSTASRIVRRVTEAIAGLRPHYIRFPQSAEEITETCEGFFRIARFPRVIGAIDCTHIKIQSPGGDQAENFRNRKGFFSFNVQTISNAKLEILDIVARWPGSSHDQTIFNNSVVKARFERGDMQNNVLVGDSGYASSMYMITPLNNPVLPEEILFQESQIRTRNVVERKYGVWKRRFPVLALGIRLSFDRVQAVIVACAVLHNLAIRMKENEPPEDPALQNNVNMAIADGQVQQNVARENAHAGGRNEFIAYFQNLL